MLKYKLSQIGKISEKVLSKVSKIDCIFLFGELGSGKTTFTRSLINQYLEDCTNDLGHVEKIIRSSNIGVGENILALR